MLSQLPSDYVATRRQEALAVLEDLDAPVSLRRLSWDFLKAELDQRRGGDARPCDTEPPEAA